MGRAKHTIVLAAALGAIAASVAGATPPSGQTSVLNAKGTTSETFKLTTPQEVTVTQKYKVKVRVKGKLVTRTRTRQVKKTVDTPFASCSAAAACDVTMQTLMFQPGGSSGWHHHPGLVVVVVKSGQVTRFKGDCSKQTFTAGQSFVETGEHDLVFVKNEGSSVAEVHNTLINAAGAATRVDDAGAPPGCTP
jgi:hypothetical protein